MKYLILVLSGFIVGSCNRSNSIKSCTYSLDSLFKNYDSLRFERTPFGSELGVDVLDASNQFGERGIYKFDKNNNLFFYAFLKDSNSNYGFSVEFDSIGKVINKTGHDVVQWYFTKPKNDSINVMFCLFGLNTRYSEISLVLKNDTVKNIVLYKHPTFSNMMAATIRLRFGNKLKKDYVLLFGKKENICASDTVIVRDSTTLPAALFEVQD